MSEQRGSIPGHEGEPFIDQRRCFYCKKPGHLIDDCRRRKFAQSNRSLKPTTKQVKSNAQSEEEKSPTDLLYSPGDDVESNTESGENLCKELPTDLLYSSDEDLLRQVRMVDEGSYSHYAHVVINGVPVEGIVDTGADITIIG